GCWVIGDALEACQVTEAIAEGALAVLAIERGVQRVGYEHNLELAADWAGGQRVKGRVPCVGRNSVKRQDRSTIDPPLRRCHLILQRRGALNLELSCHLTKPCVPLATRRIRDAVT